MVSTSELTEQGTLIEIVDNDDKILLNSPNALWYKILYYFSWEEYVLFAVEYYNSLYDFNVNAAAKREEKQNESPDVIESMEEARERLLFGRITMQSSPPEEEILYNAESKESKYNTVDPDKILPGIVPIRSAGRKPKCFFSLLKSFIGAVLMGFPAEPEKVHLLLQSNPAFMRVCEFAPKIVNDEYCYKHVPSLRKLEQFDQIMSEYGIWEKIKINEVSTNLKVGVIKKENELVGDTTHYHAFSSFETVKYIDENANEQKKSQSKITKKCNCIEKENCKHEWNLVDEGAGTIVKSSNRMHWGHKATILGFPGQEIALDIMPVADASTHDGQTIYPHVAKLFEIYPELVEGIDTVLYDSAADSADLKNRFREDFGIELRASFNPRRKKTITEGLPRGIVKLTAYGYPVCLGGYELEYQGMRKENEKYIYRSPLEDDGSSVCLKCKFKNQCCPNSETGRILNISFDLLPHINSADPPMAKRFKTIMSRRPSVERMIKKLKCDLSDDRLSKTGNSSFKAYLDKTMIGYHILLRN